jgi:hypothetical protein
MRKLQGHDHAAMAQECGSRMGMAGPCQEKIIGAIAPVLLQPSSVHSQLYFESNSEMNKEESYSVSTWF